MKRVLKRLLGCVGLIAYELLLDGSGVGIKRRWERIRAWADGVENPAMGFRRTKTFAVWGRNAVRKRKGQSG